MIDSPALDPSARGAPARRRRRDDARGDPRKGALAAPAPGRRVVNARADGPRDVDAAGGVRAPRISILRGAGSPSATRIGGIDLSANELTARGAGAVLAAVGQRPALRRSLLVVDLGANALARRGSGGGPLLRRGARLRDFGSANFECPALRGLWLPSNGIGCAGATAIAGALHRRCGCAAFPRQQPHRVRRRQGDRAGALAADASEDGARRGRDERDGEGRAGSSLRAGSPRRGEGAGPSRAGAAARSAPPRSERAASHDAEVGEGAELRALRLSFNRGDLGAAALADAVQGQTTARRARCGS